MQRPSPRTLVSRRIVELDRRVGEDIRRMRSDAGLSRRVLAETARIDVSYLSLLERGLRVPSLVTLQSIAVALGADLSVRLYPNTGPAVRDRIQAAIEDALLALAAPVWGRLLGGRRSRTGARGDRRRA